MPSTTFSAGSSESENCDRYLSEVLNRQKIEYMFVTFEQHEKCLYSFTANKNMFYNSFSRHILEIRKTGKVGVSTPVWCGFDVPRL